MCRVSVVCFNNTYERGGVACDLEAPLAAGLRDLRDVPSGRGNTGHCFNDFNHVDATTMTLDVTDNENRGKVEGIAFGNKLGPGIRVASLPEVREFPPRHHRPHQRRYPAHV